jgi:hypothetical protein
MVQAVSGDDRLRRRRTRENISDAGPASRRRRNRVATPPVRRWCECRGPRVVAPSHLIISRACPGHAFAESTGQPLGNRGVLGFLIQQIGPETAAEYGPHDAPRNTSSKLKPGSSPDLSCAKARGQFRLDFRVGSAVALEAFNQQSRQVGAILRRQRKRFLGDGNMVQRHGHDHNSPARPRKPGPGTRSRLGRVELPCRSVIVVLIEDADQNDLSVNENYEQGHPATGWLLSPTSPER